MDINTFASTLKATVLSKDKDKTLELLVFMCEQVKVDNLYANWITEPANLTEMKQILIDNFNVPPRAMLLKTRPQTRVARAVLFARALLNGMKHSQ